MKRTTALRWSLLTSLGLLPLACSGSSTDDTPDTGGASGSGGGGQVSENAGSDAEGGGGAVATPAGPPSCTSPELDTSTGLTTCAEGYRYRGEPFACEVPANEVPYSGGTPVCFPECDPEVANEFCVRVPSLAGSTTCARGCLTDDECEDVELCLCSGVAGGVCIPTECRSDSDCEIGYHCARDEGCAAPFNGWTPFICQKASDECLTNADCESQCSSALSPSTGHRTCVSVACGRPFLVGAAARVAPVVSSNAWTTRDAATPRFDHLSAAERVAQAAHWTRMGQMEHASIAAFARFSLQLLALGAPAELVDACTQALADETAHTKLCFQIASAYAGRAIGPGLLPSRSHRVGTPRPATSPCPVSKHY